MIADITLGQYFPGNSPVHKIDPRIKLLMTIVLIVSIFVCKNIYGFLFLALLTFLLTLVSGISLRVILKGFKPILLLLLFTTLIQVFFTRGGVTLVSFYFIRIDSNGILFAVHTVFRIITLIALSGVLLSYTTSPIVLTNGIEGLLLPLSKIGVPIHDFSMMMSMALRFIPTLVEETDKIMSAQRVRGTDFSSGGLIRRAKAIIPIFIPLLFSAIRRAMDLACAMECRCYRGGAGRTKFRVLRLRFSDFAWLIGAALTVAAVFVINRYTASLPFTPM